MLGCQLPSDRFGGSSGFGVALLLLVGSSAISFCAEPGPTPTCVNIADAFIKVPVLPSRLSRASERRPQVPMLIACLIAVSLLSVAALGFALSRARTFERGRERLARELSSLRGLVEAEGGRAERHEARLAELSAAQAEARREIEAARARELERERERELEREKGWELETAKGEGESRASYDSGSGGDYGTTGCAYLDSMIASAHEDGPGVSDTSNAAGEAAAEEKETEETAEEINDVYAAARRLDDFFNATTHPRELLHNETFERGVELSLGEPTFVLLARAAEYDAVVACVSLEALARREGEDEITREAVLRDINSYYYWQRFFAVLALRAHAGDRSNIA